MNHLKLVRPVTCGASAIAGVSFLLDPAQISFELPGDGAQRVIDTEVQHPIDAEPQRAADVSPARSVDAPLTTPKRNTKLTGDISELRVAVALTEAGYAVSKPLGENQRYDLIADDGKRLLRIQVKTGRLRGAVIAYSCCSSHGHRSKTLWSKPYFGQIDFLAVYCAANGKVYMIPETELVATASHLRLVPPRNNMVKTIRWATQYELA